MAYFNGNNDFIVVLSSGSGGSNVEIDATLTKEGCAAEAKATGDRLTTLEQLSEDATVTYDEETETITIK